MKPRFSVRWGSFQAKLLLYLLLVGSIPLLCAMLVFYRQSGAYAHQELSQYTLQTHEQMLLGVQQAIAEIEHTARNMAGDYAVQRYLNMSPAREPDGQGLREYIDTVLREQQASLKYMADWCILSSDTGLTVCTNESGLPGAVLTTDNVTLNKNEKLLESVDMTERVGGGSLVKLIVPVYDRRTSIAKGYVLVLININRLMTDVHGRSSLENHILFDAKGNVVYQLNPTAPELAAPMPEVSIVGDRIVSQRKLELGDSAWTSRLIVPSTFSFSTFRVLRNTFIAIFIGLVLLSVLSSLVFARYVTRPLDRLRGLMKRAELGDLRAYWIAKGTQEMNELGESYNQMLNRLEDLIKQVKREESLKKEAEIEALQYQLNPHFLYNTLNTIKWVAKLHKTPQISEVVSSLVRLLQASLGKKGDFLEIREEIGLIKDYMEIQNFRYGDKVKLQYDIDPIAAGCLVPRMILQPLVENAIIHGIEPSGRDGLITIRAWTERDILFCQVEDNGVGMEKELGQQGEARALKEKLSGIGLKHIRDKIKLYYGDDYKMYMIGKEQQGTTVRLTLPIHRNEG